MAAANNVLLSLTEELAASLEQTAASMGQLTATLEQGVDNPHQAARLNATVAVAAEKKPLNCQP